MLDPMGQEHQPLSEATIKRKFEYTIEANDTAHVRLGQDVSFVYVIRKDGNLTIPPIVNKLASNSPALDVAHTTSVLREAYEKCCRQLCDCLLDAFAYVGEAGSTRQVELHIYDPAELEAGVLKRAAGAFLVSMDPLIKGDVPLQVSRLFCLGGVADLGLSNRPGAPDLAEQISNVNKIYSDEIETLRLRITLAENFGDKVQLEQQLNFLLTEGVKLVDDDMYTGGTVLGIIKQLKSAGVKVTEVIPQLQTGDPAEVIAHEVEVTPVVKYTVQDREQLDLGDLRDFIVGISGLVVKLPSGGRGRAPYILPWVSPTARASIPTELERDFSFRILKVNLEFYREVERKIGKPITIRDLDRNFGLMMQELYGFDLDASMTKVIEWAIGNASRVSRFNEHLGFMQERLERMNLPKQIVFLDVNGTLFPDNSENGRIDPTNLAKLQKLINNLREQSVAVGLCSDTPLTQLQLLALRLGCTGPILAENGNILHFQDKELIIRELSFWREIKMSIEKLGSRRYKKIVDCVAPEFGGELPDFSKEQWAFGLGRTSSLTVFGPSEFIARLPERLIAELGNKLANCDYSFDCSPQHNFFAVHPGCNYQLNKRESLNLLSQFDNRTILMVGNSKADLTVGNVACAFVNDPSIDEEIQKQATFISDKPDIEGVIDILARIKISSV